MGISDASPIVVLNKIMIIIYVIYIIYGNLGIEKYRYFEFSNGLPLLERAQGILSSSRQA